MRIYADSSFFVSHYLPDTHSAETDIRMARGPSIWLTPLHRAEIANAFSQHVFRKSISERDSRMAWIDFQQDCELEILLTVNFPERAWQSSMELEQKYGPTLGVRTLDSLHVAAALELRADSFWTFDDRQAQLAEACGLDTNI